MRLAMVLIGPLRAEVREKVLPAGCRIRGEVFVAGVRGGRRRERE
jgi:hypothetical protein